MEDDAVVQSHDISPGDYVKVELDPEIFKAMHEGSEKAGWIDLMLEVSLNHSVVCKWNLYVHDLAEEIFPLHWCIINTGSASHNVHRPPKTYSDI